MDGSPAHANLPAADDQRLPLVMHVTTGLEIGGGEVLLLNLVEAARQRGGQTLVVSLIGDGPMRARFEAAGIEIVTLGMRRGLPSPAGLWRLVRLIRERRPEVIQGWLYHGLIAATLALLLSGSRRRTRLVQGVYGSSIDFSAYGWRVRAGFRLAAWASQAADATIYNTKMGADWHREQGFSRHDVHIVENGIDPTRFAACRETRAATRAALGIAADDIVAVSVARVDPMKGWDRLLNVTERIEGLTLLAVGRGTEAFPPHPRRLALGAREDVACLLAASDLFVLASRFGEGTSVALTEAMASGLPAIVTDVGDNARIVAESGLIVAADDEAALEASLRLLAASPERRAAMGAAAVARVTEMCSIDRALDEYYRIYCGRAA
jgi:glycosyltransferase involved in cell wall biosynthesis